MPDHIIHAAPMGDYIDAIEQDESIEYDICPGYPGHECGDIKQADSDHCLLCAGQLRAQGQERRWNEEHIAPMLERHRRIKAGLEPNRALGETIAPIVRKFWEQGK